MNGNVISFAVFFSILLIITFSLIPFYSSQNSQTALYVNTDNYAGITVYNNGLNPQFISASADFQIPHISLPSDYNSNNSYYVNFWIGLTNYNDVNTVDSALSKSYILQAGIQYQYSLLNNGSWITSLWYEIFPLNEIAVTSIISNSTMGNIFNIDVSIINPSEVYFSITDLNNSSSSFYNWNGTVSYSLPNQPNGIIQSPEVMYVMETPEVNGSIAYLPQITQTFISNAYVSEYGITQVYNIAYFINHEKYNLYNMYKNNNLTINSFIESLNPLIIELNPVSNSTT